MYGKHLNKSWARTQATIALSSAEAELYSCIRGSSGTLGLRSILLDFGETVGGQLLGDASAALGVIRRHGLGKMRHVDTSYLWIQEAAAERRLLFDKAPGQLNPSDGLTKYVTQEQISRYAGLTHCEFPDGVNTFGYTIGYIDRFEHGAQERGCPQALPRRSLSAPGSFSATPFGARKFFCDLFGALKSDLSLTCKN